MNGHMRSLILAALTLQVASVPAHARTLSRPKLYELLDRAAREPSQSRTVYSQLLTSLVRNGRSKTEEIEQERMMGIVALHMARHVRDKDDESLIELAKHAGLDTAKATLFWGAFFGFLEKDAAFASRHPMVPETAGRLGHPIRPREDIKEACDERN